MHTHTCTFEGCGKTWECDLLDRICRELPGPYKDWEGHRCFIHKAQYIDILVPPKVWNKRDPNTPKDAIYVGRPTKWGNNYSHLRSNVPGIITVKDRMEAIERYTMDIKQDPSFLKQVRDELWGRDLVCWCAPKPCHADILLLIANGWCV